MQQQPGAAHPAQGFAASTAEGQQMPAAGGGQCRVKGSVEGSARTQKPPAAGALQFPVQGCAAGALQCPVQGSAVLTSVPALQASLVGCPGPRGDAQPVLHSAPSLQSPPPAVSSVCRAAEAKDDGSSHPQPAREPAPLPAVADALGARSQQGCCCPLPSLTEVLQQDSTSLSPYKQMTLPAPPKAAQWTQKREVTHCIAFLRHPGNMAGAACEVSAMHAKLPSTDTVFQQTMALQRANPERQL